MSAPSAEQLAALVAAQEQIIARLQAWIVEQDARIGEQDARIAELERQLAAFLRNSFQPPSADGLDKPAPKSLRGRSGRKPGGQPGRQGRTLRQVAVLDEVVVHEPGACRGCGAALAAGDGLAGVGFDGRCSTSRRSPCGWLSIGWCPAAAPVARSPRLPGRPGSPRRCSTARTLQ